MTKLTHTHTHTHIYIYIYIYACAGVEREIKALDIGFIQLEGLISYFSKIHGLNKVV
jgi:hypothetical protein